MICRNYDQAREQKMGYETYDHKDLNHRTVDHLRD